MEKTSALLPVDFEGLCFVNLVETDMIYGHRRDIDGYANAITEFDKWLGEFEKQMNDDDIIMVTADHGCDPGLPEPTIPGSTSPFVAHGKETA